MFEFLMSADLGINPIDIGAVTPTFSSAFSTPLPPMTEPLSEETIARFQAAMEKPLADNAILQQALESMVVTKEKPVVVVGDKPVVSDRPQDKVLATENTKVTEAAIVEKPVSVETPKASESSVNFVAKELPVATPETFMAVVVENKEVAKVFEAIIAEKPVVISEKPIIAEKPTAAEKPVTIVDNKMVVQVPVLATENTKVTEAAIVEKLVSVETPKVVVAETPKVSEPSVNFVAKEQPVVVSVDKPVVSDRPQDKVLATENTKITENTTTVVSEKPQVVVPETPKASAPSVNFVAKEIAPEKPVIVVSEKSVVQVEAPVLHTESTEVTERAIVDKPVVADKPQQVVVAEAPIVKVATVKVEDETQPEEVTIAALPQGVAPEAIVRPIEAKPLEVAPVVSASVEAKVEAVTAAEVLVQAATAVADTMLVSPGLMRGEGEIIVHLKPEVLEATELKISVQSGTMTVEFAPTVEKIATLLTQNQANLVQVLSERVGRYNVVVNVRPSHLKGTRNARA